MADEKVPQLHREEFVLTLEDLVAIRNGWAVMWLNTPKWRVIERLKYRAAVGTVDSLLRFIQNGKVGKNLEDVL